MVLQSRWKREKPQRSPWTCSYSLECSPRSTGHSWRRDVSWSHQSRYGQVELPCSDRISWLKGKCWHSRHLQRDHFVEGGFRWRFRTRVTCSQVSWMERILPNGQVSLLCGKHACCCSKKTTVNILTLKKKRVNIPVGMSSRHLDDIAQAVWRTYF